jgi:hypothetical protein
MGIPISLNRTDATGDVMADFKNTQTAPRPNPMPGEPDPLSPGRTDLNPDDEPGIDELPDNDGARPDQETDEPDQTNVPDIDPDNAEMDEQPNPR